MLKKISKLFLGLVVCAGSACVTPTHASSATSSNSTIPGVVMVYIQAASPQSAKDEMITLYNNSTEVINVTNWCLTNKANVKFACISQGIPNAQYYLHPSSYLVLSTQSFIDNNYGLPENISFIFTPTNQSSGSIVNGSDTISLVTAQNQVVDTFSWTTAVPSGKVAARALSESGETYQTDSPNVWSFASIEGVPEGSLELRIEISGDSGNFDNPDDPNNPEETDPTVHHQVLFPIITELFPNPLGSDVGNEFVEVFNPNETVAIDMSQYKLRVGTKVYSFTVGTVLEPLQYRAFYNSEIKFTLVNTAGSVALEKDGSIFDDTIQYQDPVEGQAYALFNGSWQYTTQPTPRGVNVLSTDLLPISKVVSTLKPCAQNQYRSPETNRCRLIRTTQSSGLKPCAANQYRSPETNRCRALASASSSALSSCKEGQERNPETNRCRNVVKMSQADYGVKGVQTEESEAGVGWYWWLAAVGLGGAIVSYIVWEWRAEILKICRQLKSKFARMAR